MKSKINWCTHGWNVISGCSKISEGCKNCYANDLHKRFTGTFGDFNKVRFNLEKLSEPKRVKKPANIFVNPLSDTFHPDVCIDDIENIWDMVDICKRHNFLILTKRASRMREFINYKLTDGRIPDNLWLGVTVENQKEADRRIPDLLECYTNSWLSVEPLLEAIDLERYLSYYLIKWVIVGCESGLHKRECRLEWIEKVVEQCKEYDVPVFVKQLNINCKIIKDFNEFPDSLKIRQVPYKLYDNLKFWKPELEIQKYETN